MFPQENTVLTIMAIPEVNKPRTKIKVTAG
jgi:hypothetical protein